MKNPRLFICLLFLNSLYDIGIQLLGEIGTGAMWKFNIGVVTKINVDLFPVPLVITYTLAGGADTEYVLKMFHLFKRFIQTLDRSIFLFP